MLALPCVATVLVACGSSSGSDGSGPASTAPSPGGELTALDLIPDLVDHVAPSIVSVVTDAGQGSGVVYDAEHGIVVTNDHVVAGAGRVGLILSNGDRTPAQVRATDPGTDLAILETDHHDLAEATFAEELPRVGELAIAVGNPLGFSNTVTSGIVSALHRSLDQSVYIDLIQTDAPISPGNSGGALFNAEGQVIGINTAGIPATENANSLGFAIPSPTAIRVVNQLIETGAAHEPLLGVIPSDVSANEREQLRIEGGARVDSVTDGSPAASAGIEAGDVIVQVAGAPVRSTDELRSALRRHAPGDEITVVVLRDGERLDIAATLGERQAP